MNGRGLGAEKIVSRDLDTVGESHGGLLAHIIDSRVAARDASALLCPVERWQEAWFRDNSFLIACLIHTTSNYTAVPRASVSYSKSFRGRNSRRLCLSSPSSDNPAPLFRRFLLAPFVSLILFLTLCPIDEQRNYQMSNLMSS